MWQFAEAVRGLADGCMELGVPVTGGNVSLYNQTGGKAINPTPRGRDDGRNGATFPAHPLGLGRRNTWSGYLPAGYSRTS